MLFSGRGVCDHLTLQHTGISESTVMDPVGVMFSLHDDMSSFAEQQLGQCIMLPSERRGGIYGGALSVH